MCCQYATSWYEKDHYHFATLSYELLEHFANAALSTELKIMPITGKLIMTEGQAQLKEAFKETSSYLTEVDNSRAAKLLLSSNRLFIVTSPCHKFPHYSVYC